MYISVANAKGGACKTTTAVHLAGYLQQSGPTLLIDGDPNRSATAWAKRGKLPFTIVGIEEGPYQARNFQHVIIDTEARPGNADLEKLAKGCDLLVIPAVPATLDTDALVLTIGALNRLAPDKYRVLLAKVPPLPEQDGPQLRAALKQQDIPLFTTEIPRLKCFEKAVAEGVLVSQVNDPRASRAWECYEAAGKEIVKWLRANSRNSLMSA
jgi:chromosome partitioning protein